VSASRGPDLGMRLYTLLCAWLARLLMAFLLVGLGVIVVALTLQVCSATP